MSADLEPPVAWRWRYVYPDGPGFWTVRQSPAVSSPSSPGFAAVEAEPLYRSPRRAVETLKVLAAAEAQYRSLHDLYGEGDRRVGHAWDRLRAAGDEARAALASVDTHPKDGDALAAPLVSGAVPAKPGDAQPSHPIVPSHDAGRR